MSTAKTMIKKMISIWTGSRPSQPSVELEPPPPLGITVVAMVVMIVVALVIATGVVAPLAVVLVGMVIFESRMIISSMINFIATLPASFGWLRGRKGGADRRD